MQQIPAIVVEVPECEQSPRSVDHSVLQVVPPILTVLLPNLPILKSALIHIRRSTSTRTMVGSEKRRGLEAAAG
jgi:hypothetical protein